MASLPDGIEFTWLGHATFRIKTPSGRMLLIDPWVMQNPACPDELKDPGPLDAMLITHGHFDHIADAVEIAKSKTPQVVSIPETSHWLASKGVENLVEMNKGGTVEVAGCRVHMVHAVHSCGITDGDQIIYGGEAAGYVIEFENGFKALSLGRHRGLLRHGADREVARTRTSRCFRSETTTRWGHVRRPRPYACSA